METMVNPMIENAWTMSLSIQVIQFIIIITNCNNSCFIINRYPLSFFNNKKEGKFIKEVYFLLTEHVQLNNKK